MKTKSELIDGLNKVLKNYATAELTRDNSLIRKIQNKNGYYVTFRWSKNPVVTIDNDVIFNAYFSGRDLNKVALIKAIKRSGVKRIELVDGFIGSWFTLRLFL